MLCNKHIYTLAAVLMALTAVVAPQSARAYAVKMITDVAQLSTNGNTTNIGYLIDDKTTTDWSSKLTAGGSGGNHYVQADFPDGVGGENIWVGVTLPSNKDVNPTALRIEGSNDGGASWTRICNANVLYRRGVIVYIGPLNLTALDDAGNDVGYRTLRFTCIANTHTASDPGYDGDYSASDPASPRNLYMTLAGLQVFRYSDDSTEANTTSTYDKIDPYHVRGQLAETYKDYTFEHTLSYLYRKQDTGSEWGAAAERLWNTTTGDFLRTEQDGKILSDNAIELPVYKYLEPGGSDPRITVGKRQPSHTYEHTIYAVPGDVILLYPHSDINSTNNYYQSYVRWYDFSTDMASPYVDCLYYPDGVETTPYGYFGSTVFTNNRQRGCLATFLCPPAEEFAQNGDLYIACDFSHVSATKANIVQTSTSKLMEPVVHFRHIFTVKDGREQARQLSATAESNRQWIKEHRRRISARAGADFQQRLEFPVPYNNNGNVGYSQLYYMTSDDAQECVYRRLCSCKIVAYDASGATKSGFGFTSTYAGVGYNSTTKEKWFDYERSFYRFLSCSAANAKEGTYIVKLYALDEKGNVLRTADGAQDLQVAEYEITFMPAAMASFLTEEQLATDTYQKHRPDYLEGTIGNPIAKIDYDEYRAVQEIKDGNTYLYVRNGTSWTNGIKARELRWPLNWEHSTYSFGYSERRDYDMYRISNHSSMTAYHAAADKRTSGENFDVTNGLFDRLFYDTEGRDAGYFFYLNAATDPGIIAQLNCADLCTSSTLYVSAWVAEFSNDAEVANVVFHFNAILKDGSEQAIHSFTTGYVTQKGVWFHAFYEFTPDFAALGLNASDIDHYTLTLENNCKSSGGADYAIDDVRVYVAKPRVYAEQMEPLCDKNATSTQVKVEIPFGVLLSSIGEAEAASATDAAWNTMFFTTLDKDEYDALYNGDNYVQAFNSSIVKYEYMAGEGSEQSYGRFRFSTHYDSNGDMCQTIDGERMIVFTTQPTDKDMKTGKEYMIVLYLADGETTVLDDLPTCFDLNDKCVKMCTLRVKSSTVVKIDGLLAKDPEDVWACSDQLPVVQLNLYGSKPGDTNLQVIRENAYCDWYLGNVSQFEAETSPDGSIMLFDAITKLRDAYPTADTWDMDVTDIYTQPIKDYLQTMVEGTETVSPKLVLYQNSYTFRTAAVSSTAGDVSEIYLTAIPAEVVEEDLKVCSAYVQICLKVSGSAPKMLHGFAEVDYPDGIEPAIRIGYAQIQAASASPTTLTPQTTLAIPLRLVAPATTDVDKLLRDDNDVYIYLIGTNDPDYADLHATYGDGLIEVGQVVDITANRQSAEGNLMTVSFFNNFSFKEGCYYRLKFRFVEETPETTAQPGDVEEEIHPCSGELAFTLKVVPQYQKWVGSSEGPDGSSTPNRNWNNDANWARVSSADLYRAPSSSSHYTTDGINKKLAAGYAPMDFTCVLIPKGESYPHLYPIPQVSGPFFNGDGTTAKTLPYSKITPAAAEAGSATSNAEYDMYAYTGTSSIYCRLWRGNVCKEMNFRPGAEIFGQQFFTSYEKAWVEMALTPRRWYTLAAPLQSIVAGDMYLPSATSRQETELFQAINFNTSLHDRFNPAVYQRSWDKATANVVTLDGTKENVAIRTTWSHVYNDVAEWYRGGTGYSIKIDSDVAEALMRLPKNDGTYYYYDQNKVRGEGVGSLRKGGSAFKFNDVSKEFAVTISGANSSCRYFLVGNPFMCHMDMARFLQANSGVVAPKYWVMTADSQRAAIMGADGHLVGVASDGSDNAVAQLPPMQGFFVEALAPGSELTVMFSPDMAVVPSEAGDSPKPFLAPSRGGDAQAAPSAMLRITALSDGVAASCAAIRPDAAASAAYDGFEDVALFYDPDCQDVPMVYTLAGTTATSLNALPADVAAIPLGVAAPTDAPATLRFDGVDALPGAMLYDAADDAYFDLCDGFEYSVAGPSAGRLFIATAECAATPALADEIAFSVAGQELTVASLAAAELEVAVCDALGRTVAAVTAPDGVARLTLAPGVYLARAATPTATATAKLLIP